MNTRMCKVIFYIVAVVVFGCAAKVDTTKGVYVYPREERLRPMILPLGMWQVSGDVSEYFYKNHDGTWANYFSYNPGIIPSRSLSRRVEIQRFPWLPYVKVLLTENDIGLKPDGTMNRFAVTFSGGVTGFLYSETDGFSLSMRSAVNTKFLLNERWWHQQGLSFDMDYRMLGQSNACGLWEGLGFQITDYVAMTMGIGGGLAFGQWQQTKAPSANGSANVQLNASITKRISVAVGGALIGGKLLDGSKPWFSGMISPKLTIQW